MNGKKGAALLAALAGSISLFFILIQGVLFVSQPVYRYGLEFRLTDSGYRLAKVVPGMAAARSGLHVGDTIVRIGATEVAALNALRLRSTRDYLHATSQLFTGRPLAMVRADGAELVLDPTEWTAIGVLSSVLDTTLSNIVNGFLIVLIGTLFTIRGVLRGRQDTALWLYFTFTCTAGIGLSLSYFHSHWSLPFLQAHFVLLIVFGPIAGITLAGFAAHFPAPAPVARNAAWALLLLPLIRVALLLLGWDNLFGVTHFAVHLTALAGIGIFAVRLILQYRRHNALGRRRLRWVIAGSLASVTPYVVFLAYGLVVGTFVEYAHPGVLNQLAAFFVLVFPVAMGIGLVDFDRVDVDRVTTAALTYFVLGVIIAIITGLLYMVTQTGPAALRYAAIVLITVVFGPTIFARVTRFSARGLDRRRARIGLGMRELRNALLATYRTVDTFNHAAHFAREYLGAPAAAVLELNPPEWQNISTSCGVANGGELAPDLIAVVLGQLPVSPENPILLPGNGVALHCVSGITTDYLLVLHPRDDGDIFVEDDRQTLRELAYLIGQTLRAAHYYEGALERNTQLEATISEKNTLLREVHHRVKNNLQIMSSLLNLQMAESGPEVTAALELAVARIQSMALVHEATFGDADVERINLNDFVSSLSAYLAGSSRDVRITVESMERVVAAGFALPFGLILLESIGRLMDEGHRDLLVRLGNLYPEESDCLALEVHAHLLPPSDGEASVVIDQHHHSSSDLIVEALCSQIGARRTRRPGLIRFDIGCL